MVHNPRDSLVLENPRLQRSDIKPSELHQLQIEESRLRSTSTTRPPTPTLTESPSTPAAAPTSYSQNSILLIRMAPKRDDDSVHVSGEFPQLSQLYPESSFRTGSVYGTTEEAQAPRSPFAGKIQMDLNIEGNVKPNARNGGLLSKLI